MNPKGYLIFHLNLGFSSIEEDSRADVIKTCYHSLLDLIEQTGIPIGVELTGSTLSQINQIDNSWVSRFKKLLNSNSCELIGSGYSQIIGPLAPSKVNEWNQRLGIKEYTRILGVRPEIVLVNEMAYSNSLVDVYEKFGYKGFIMERNNVHLALGIDNFSVQTIPTHANGNDGAVLPILWSDSILFQKMQHYAHGDISIEDYLDLIKERISIGEEYLPIYSNDAEVFDFRPGRFDEERKKNSFGEWKRLKNALIRLSSDFGMEWVLPTEALSQNNKNVYPIVSHLTSLQYPIPVKKQAKYNISRWAITGRNDLWINTMCHRIAKYFLETKNNSSDDWRELCELWASDLRTHITEKRWINAEKKLNEILKKNKISTINKKVIKGEKFETLENTLGDYGSFKIKLEKEGTLLQISSNKIKLGLNLRRGLTINSLAFSSQKMQPCLGTLPHGFFSNITNGVDYYSGGLIVELPTERKKITDLNEVKPTFVKKKNGDIEIHVVITTSVGNINKVILLSSSQEKISISYQFVKWLRPIGSIRLGIITLFPEMFGNDSIISCANGGKNNESFKFNKEVSHIKASSSLVSSSAGFGATEGEIIIGCKKNYLKLRWDPEECAAFPMFENKALKPFSLARLYFSLLEADDTSKISKAFIPSFKLTISC